MRSILIGMTVVSAGLLGLPEATDGQSNEFYHLSVDDMRSQAGALGECSPVNVKTILDCEVAAKECFRFFTQQTCDAGDWYSECPEVDDGKELTSLPAQSIHVKLWDCPLRLKGPCIWSWGQSECIPGAGAGSEFGCAQYFIEGQC